MATKIKSTADKKLKRPLSELNGAIANRCHGSTLVVGDGSGHLTQMIEDRQINVLRSDSTGADASAGQPQTMPRHSELERSLDVDKVVNTVVLANVLHYVSEESSVRLLRSAWELLRAGGRLIVAVPNDDRSTDLEVEQRFTERRLKRLLEHIGKPKVITEQPLKWLMMLVTKDEGAGPPLSHTNKVRFAAVSKLCHGKIIELGCGPGHLAKMISDCNLNVTGVEINGKKIRQAQERHPQITFIHSDICELTLPSDSFDTVILAEVLEHVSEEKGAEILGKARDLIKPDGRIIISVPNEQHIPHPNHVREFSQKDLKSMLGQFGCPELVTDQPYKWLMMYVDCRATSKPI